MNDSRAVDYVLGLIVVLAVVALVLVFRCILSAAGL